MAKVSDGISARFDGETWVIHTLGNTWRFTKREMSDLHSRINAINEMLCYAYPPIEYNEFFERIGGYGTKEEAIKNGAKF